MQQGSNAGSTRRSSGARRTAGMRSVPANTLAYQRQRSAQHRRAAAKRRRSIKRQNTLRRVGIVLLVVVCCVGGLAAWGSGVINSILKTGDKGILNPLISTGAANAAAAENGAVDVPVYSGGDIVNVLILGLDMEEGRSAFNSDMVLYVHFDRSDKANMKLNILQIPRDCFVGESLSTGGTGKLNAVYGHGEDTENPVNNLAEGVIYNQLKLPVDYYLTMDMDAFKEIVNRFGGIEVYVSQDLDYYNKETGALEGHLAKGWRWLLGDEAEFFVRNRQSFTNADLGRIENQRYFYSAFFKRLRTMTPRDIIKLMPVFTYFCNTNMTVTDAAALGIDLLSVQSSNITFARLPVYASDKYKDYSVVCIAPQEAADLLNTYFRTPGTEVSAAGLDVKDWMSYGDVIDAAVKTMGDVEQTEAPES